MTSSVWAYATNTTRSARKHKYAESRAKEMQSHYDRGTWDIVPRTEATNKGCKVYRCSFVDKMKVLEDGTCKAKSRLVCNQSTGKSFRTDPKHEARTSPNRETFAGCAQMTSFRLLVALAAKFNLELFILNATALEDVYMEQPPGYHTHGRDFVCKLRLGLYGTQLANRGWYLELHSALTEFGHRIAREEWSASA